MPLFAYICGKCRKRSEILVRRNEAPACPHCGSGRLVKQASAFAAVRGASTGGAALPAGCESCDSRRNGTCSRF
jgi:putative FmdB family regulatory protein